MSNQDREPLELVYAGEMALHCTNEHGICQYCGRLREELLTGKFKCHRNFKQGFKGTEYVKAPRHPLFLDAVTVIRNCGYCQNTRQNLCKRHQALKEFLE